MTYYIAPSTYPIYFIDIINLERKLLDYCLENNYVIYNSINYKTAATWNITNKYNNLELSIANDAASIEFNSSSKLLLIQFILFIWKEYPTSANIHLIAGDLSSSYLLRRDSSFEQIEAFLS
jgi:hypothetical protein